MKMRAYKTEIDPTEAQIEKIKRTQGVCRFVYNLFIATNRDRHRQGLVKSATGTTSNLDKQRVKVQRAYHRLECIRKDFVNKTVSELVKAKPSYITVEDLCVSGMLKNRRLSRAVSESLFYTFRTTLVRKCRESGIEVRLADRFYPSSKQCSSCGAMRRDLKLSDRVYRCPVCGLEIDRDLGAALNLKDCTRYYVA